MRDDQLFVEEVTQERDEGESEDEFDFGWVCEVCELEHGSGYWINSFY
jgi:hypothetical protein